MFRPRMLAVAAVLSVASNPVHAGFGSCTLVNSPLATGAEPLDFARLAMRADGRPLLVYTTDVHNASSIHLYDCATPTCAAGHGIDLDSSYNYFGSPGIALRADGRPLVSASHHGGIRLYDCADAACSSYSLHDVRPESSAIFSDMPVTLQASGNPVFLYLDGVLGTRPGYLIVHFCADASCDAAGTEQVLAMPDPNTPMFSGLSLALGSDGTLAAAYLSSVGGSNLNTYHIARCSDAACSGVTDTQLAVPVGNGTPVRTALALRTDQRPLALDSQPEHRVLLDCTARACNAWNDRALPTTGAPLGLKLLSGNVPAYALFDASTVSAIACNDANCGVGNGLFAATPTQSVLDGDFALDASARPAVAYIDFDTRTLAVAACEADVLFIDGFD